MADDFDPDALLAVPAPASATMKIKPEPPATDPGISPAMRGVLYSVIAPGESGGRNVIYGGKEITDLSKHPDVHVPITTGPNAGLYSTAAGPFQFIKSTYDMAAKETGKSDFSIPSQEENAAWLAKKTYRDKTGRDLESDYASGDPKLRDGIKRALASQWESLGKPGPRVDKLWSLSNDRVRFSDEALAAHDDSDDTSTVYMHPEHYLSLAPSFEDDPEHSYTGGKALRASLAKGESINNIPHLTLDADGKVIDSDGRGRALAANTAGLDAIPVALKNIAKLPDRLTGASGNTVQTAGMIPKSDMAVETSGGSTVGKFVRNALGIGTAEAAEPDQQTDPFAFLYENKPSADPKPEQAADQTDPFAHLYGDTKPAAEVKPPDNLPWDVPLTGDQMRHAQEMTKKSDEALHEPSEPGLGHLLWSMVSEPLKIGQTALGQRPLPQGAEALGMAAVGATPPPVAEGVGGLLGKIIPPEGADRVPPPSYPLVPLRTREEAAEVGKLVEENVRAIEAKVKPRPEIIEAHKAGYVFPPSEIVPLDESPSKLASALAGESGKIKLQQVASTRNQINSDKLAARGIGLPENTLLDERGFDTAKQPAIQVYREMADAVPELDLKADGKFQKDISGVGGHGSLLEQFFPELAANPKILEVREQLRRQEEVPTNVAMQAIAAFRKEADANFRVVGDATAHATALAQRQAADVLEDAVGRAVKDAPEYFANKFAEAGRASKDARADVAYAQNKVTQALAKQISTENVYTIGSALTEQRTAEAVLAKAQSALDAAEASKTQWLSRLRESQEKGSALQTLPDRFQDARKLFAKIYDVEDATNRTTGHVSAKGLARIYNKGAPLTGELKSIAEAHNAAPKSMQMPELFGRAEDWSALDFFGMATAAMHGNPLVGAGIVGRPAVRNMLLGPGAQRRMIPYEKPIPALTKEAPLAVGATTGMQPP